jgi:murein DD-endopeptidase MepM/ murein hydrolase activator NlpD
MTFPANCASVRMVMSALIIGLGTMAPSIAEVRTTGSALTKSGDSSVWPTQVLARVGFSPMPFRADGHSSRIIYELYLTNFSDKALSLNGLEVRDRGRKTNSPIATFTGQQLASMYRLIGEQSDNPKHDVGPPSIPPGSTVVVFLSVTLRPGLSFPAVLEHRLSLGSAVVDGASINLQTEKPLTLASPVDGMSWIAADGPNDDPDNHHRRGILIVDGDLRLSRRYAIDWKQVRNGASFTGNAHDDQSYYAYSKPVHAVAEARVLATRDGVPDNPPGHGKDFHPAIPITFDNVGGNTIILDLGNRQFAHYYHLEPGSIRVKAGDHVRVGQIIGLIGASGDAREPHLHFEVTTSAIPLKGEGLPYVIPSFDVVTGSGQSIRRTMELPVGGTMVNFAQ